MIEDCEFCFSDFGIQSAVLAGTFVCRAGFLVKDPDIFTCSTFMLNMHHYISLLIRICICLLLRFEDMDYDAVISSAETTIGLVEAIRKSMAEQAGSLFVRKNIQVFT